MESMPSAHLLETESMESMPKLHLLEPESVEMAPVAKASAVPTVVGEAPSVESLPSSSLFERESSEDIPVNYDDDELASVVNSVISGEELTTPFCAVEEYKGVELPFTENDVNLASLINDKELWEMSSVESEAMNMNFDLTDADIEHFDWEMSSTEM